MKAHTNDFKNEIKLLGRELDSKITYTLNGDEIVLDGENINSISPHYEGAILKSVMKQLDLDIDTDIPVNTILNAQFGVKVNGIYEYLDLGNYVVYKTEKQEDLGSYRITCYDKMLYSMKAYETPKLNNVAITYPITIKNYIKAICETIGLDFANENDDFTNHNKLIPHELYLDDEGGSLNYTFRDVLDELAEVTASTICINDDDELEIRYVNNVGEYLEVEGTNLQINSRDTNDFDIQLEGDTYQETTTGQQLYDVFDPLAMGDIVSIDNDGWITVSYNNSSGTSTKWFDCKTKISNLVQTNTTYKLVVEIKNVSGTGTVNFMAVQPICQFKGNAVSTQLNSTTTGVNTYNITTKDDFTGCTSLLNSYGRFNAGESGSITFRMSLIANTSITPETFTYEPYTNGASPNPDYPQPVQVVTGENVIKICGKNLCPTDFNNWESGQYNTSGVKENAPRRLRLANLLAVKPNTAYYFDTNYSPYKLVVRTFDNNGNFVASRGSITNGETYTTANNEYFLGISIFNSSTETGESYSKYETLFENQDLKPFICLNALEDKTYTQYQEQNYTIDLGTTKLAKITTYKDRIFKSSGKNLFSGATIGIGINSTNGSQYSNNTGASSDYISLNITGSNTYTISGLPTNLFNFIGAYNSSKQFLGRTVATAISLRELTASSFTSGTPQGTGDIAYIRLTIYENINVSGTIDEVENSNIMLNIGSTALPCEPYGKDWYIEKKIGEVVLDGTIGGYNSGNNWFYIGLSNLNIGTTTNKLLCDHFTFYENFTSLSSTTIGIGLSNTLTNFLIRNTALASESDYKTWLGNNNTIVYYILATPTYTKITNTELINQLESIRLLEGVNNISVGSDNLSSPIKLTYLASRDTIDEEFLKDVNVNFGEKYGPINTIILSRNEVDNISQSAPSNLEDSKKKAIKIVDNQIMNFDDRDEYLTEILKRLNGLSYYINDFASTGIVYYNICDKYDVSIDGKLYDCIMLNDEVNITQGLVENIYTEMPEKAEEEYKYMTSTDKGINQAYLKLNKQEQTFELMLSQSNTDLEGRLDEKYNQIYVTNEAFTIEQGERQAIDDQINDEGGLKDKITENSQKLNNVSKFFRYINGVLILGESNSNFQLELEGGVNGEIRFMGNGTRLGYFSSEKLYVENTTVFNNQMIAKKGDEDATNYYWHVTDDGCLDLDYGGTEE